MEKTIIVHSIQDIDILKEKILLNTIVSTERLKRLVYEVQGIQVLKELKFKKMGYDPLFDEDINFIEFLNQSLTYLVCLCAAKWLSQAHEKKSFKIHMGTQTGYDIESIDGTVICECFAATSVKSNKKLEKDILRVYGDSNALYKYVIFYTAENDDLYINRMRNKYNLVSINRIEFEQLVN